MSPSNDGMVLTYSVPSVSSFTIDVLADEMTIKFKTHQGTDKIIKEKYSKILSLTLQK